MKTIRSTMSLALGLGFLAIPAVGQFYSPMTIDPSLLKFLPEDAAFTAKVEVTSRAPAYRWPVRVVLFKGMTRVEMDISKMAADQTEKRWADYVGQMQKAGSAESVTIYNPDRKCVFTVLPRIKAYTQQPIPDNALAQLKQWPKAQKVELGAEEIDGRTATKTRVVFSKDEPAVWRTRETPEAIIWMAKDAPGIPLRIQVLNSVGETHVTLVFKDVKLKKPGSALFLPPKGFSKCDQESLTKLITAKWPKDK